MNASFKLGNVTITNRLYYMIEILKKYIGQNNNRHCTVQFSCLTQEPFALFVNCFFFYVQFLM